MFSLHPVGLHHYLGLTKLRTPTKLRRLFYASWEDALWDLLLYFRVPHGAVALVPEFFCTDVVNNMAAHGLRCVYYPVNQQLQTKPQKLAQLIKSQQPQVLVVLHAAGITNQLLGATPTWAKYLSSDALLIEDSVHRVVDPTNIHLLTQRHMVIDSMRKVAPLTGSNLYGDANTLVNLRQNKSWLTLPYRLAVFGWWLIFQVYLSLATWPLPKALINFFKQKSHEVMQKGYDLIGDSYLGSPGWRVMSWLSQYLNIPHIKSIKQQQAAVYQKKLAPLWSSHNFFEIKFTSSDASELRGFPVGIRLFKCQSVLSQLIKQQLAWKYELSDCPWSQRQKLIYLPLGPHINSQQIVDICHRLLSVN